MQRLAIVTHRAKVETQLGVFGVREKRDRNEFSDTHKTPLENWG
jgi:hypothetical protein